MKVIDKQQVSRQRRRLLQSSAGLLALSALPAWAGPASAGAMSAGTVNGVLLFKPELQAARAFSRFLPRLHALPAEGDLVRIWRGGLAESYRQGLWIAGLSHWDELFLLRELAHETRLRPLVLEQAHERRVLDTGAGLREAALGLERLMAGAERVRPLVASREPLLFSWAIRAV